jgi:glycosyltransferase involved in cell wall biosynthesis
VQGYVDANGLAFGRFVVDLTGRLSPEHVLATLAGSDAFVAPARLESFGIAALEARTVGLPVLAYEGTGIASFVRDEVEGLLAADDEAMIAAIARIASDDDLRTRITAYNRGTDPDQAWPHVLATCEAAYAEAALR